MSGASATVKGHKKSKDRHGIRIILLEHFNFLSFISLCLHELVLTLVVSLLSVKFSIKSFRVPELYIEVPETASVGSMKVCACSLPGLLEYIGP